MQALKIFPLMYILFSSNRQAEFLLQSLNNNFFPTFRKVWRNRKNFNSDFKFRILLEHFTTIVVITAGCVSSSNASVIKPTLMDISSIKQSAIFCLDLNSQYAKEAKKQMLQQFGDTQTRQMSDGLHRSM